MGETVAVLVVPAEGDPGGLLSPGRCSAVPPVVVSGHVCVYDYHREWQPLGDFVGSDCYMCRHPVRALPLWWDGALVPEGWDRFVRAACTLAGDDRPVSRFPALADMLRAASPSPGTAASLLASRVIRLARVDGRLVEVP